MPRAKHRRKGKTRPRGKPPRMPPWLPWLEEDEADKPSSTSSAEDLLDWQPRIQRERDPRQGDLFALGPPSD